ncbi:hypothetical protein HF325_004811 [Metschnikowia pulcherrima]|uniref:Protein kinase domain-containing protein n=1 Tax=Metschnikowia pulcherrima TaxID=27326 RepID=A0A8H7GQ62_9ASCO|nr:hypothetical protein HF325_004811 [Metschnikowia pulcherrima]
MWAIYPAKHKQTGKMVSVFIFEKPRFEAQVHRLCNQTANTRNPRQIVAEYYEQIRIEISQLTKLKHPQILTVLEVMEETKLKFLFVTEPVTANLATLDLQKETLLSIQKGLLEISKGLQFLHSHCSIIHMNIQPSSVFVNTQGDWKLAGFKFLQNLNELSPLDRENFYIMNSSSVVETANHNLNFTAPELILDSSGVRLGMANDMWALGMLIYYLYNKGDCMINCFEVNSLSDFKAEFRKFELKFYNHRPSELKYMFKEVPESLWAIMTQLLARYPNDRILIDQFIDSDFFDGSLIKMMWFIDEFTTKTMGEKIVFLDGLLGHSDLLPQLPSTFRNSKLLPLLVDAIKSEVGLLPLKKLDLETDAFLSKSLLLVFSIGGLLSNLSFQDRIYDGLLSTTKTKKTESPFLRLFQISVKIRLAIILNTDLFLKKLTQKQVVELMKEVPTLCVTISRNDIDQQADQIKLQDTYLSNLSLVVELFDFPYIKNTLLPLICQVFKTTTIPLHKNSNYQNFRHLLPVLENLKSRDKRIVGAVIGFFVRLSASQHIALDLETMVEKILGQCLRLIFGCSDCSKSEFKELLESLKKIEDVALDEKLKTLSDVARDPANEDFSTLLNSALVRQKPEEPSIKAPVLQPTSAVGTENSISPQNTRHDSCKALDFDILEAESGIEIWRDKHDFWHPERPQILFLETGPGLEKE